MNTITKHERDSMMLAQRIICQPGNSDLIFIGGRLKGQFYRSMSKMSMRQKLYFLAMETLEETCNLNRLVGSAMNILRKNCKLTEVKMNPYDIYVRNYRRLGRKE